MQCSDMRNILQKKIARKLKSINFNLVAAPPTGSNCEPKLKHTHQFSSKSVQSFRRSTVTYTLTEEFFIQEDNIL